MKRELVNFEISEYCEFDEISGKVKFYKGKNRKNGFTGFYFNDGKTFFAVYPTKKGPAMFYKGKEYELHKDLTIAMTIKGKDRNFTIKEYGIDIDFKESEFLGVGDYANEDDLNMFCYIAEGYKKDNFYDDRWYMK